MVARGASTPCQADAFVPAGTTLIWALAVFLAPWSAFGALHSATWGRYSNQQRQVHLDRGAVRGLRMSFRWLCLLCLLLPGIAVAAVTNASFGMPTRLTVERNLVENVAIGDVDGDGRVDLAVTAHLEGNRGAHNLRLYFQNQDGTLSSPTVVSQEYDLNDVNSVSMADMNGDGAKEVVIGVLGGINIVHWSAVRMPSVTTYQGPASSCRIIATGDVDGDGKMDVACHGRNEWPNTAVVYFGNGQGGIRNVIGMETGAGDGMAGIEFKGLAVGDVTGDGRADLVVTAASSPNFYVLPNNGHGGFQPPVAYAHPMTSSQGWPVSVVISDLDKDGVNEVVFANPQEAPDARLNIYRLGGSGALYLSQQIAIRSSATALLVGDVGGDGDKDMVLGHWSYASVSVLGDTDVSIKTQGRYELPGFGNDVMYELRTGSTNALALGDLNGDGCNDLASATYSGVTLLYGCKPYLTSLPVSDFDGDGVSDLYWRQFQPPAGLMMFWPWASKQASYDCPMPCPPYVGQLPWIDQAVGDFDGDGSSDVFFRNPETGQNRIALRAFYAVDGVTVANKDWEVVGAGDFDDDDRSDLFWRNRRTGETIIWWAGQYAGLTWEMQVPDLNWQVATVGDFDGDGKADVFWKHATTGRNIIWWGGRSARLQEVTRVVNTQWRIFGNGDFNGDGRADVIWRNTVTGAGIIWYSGKYTTQAALTTITNLDWKIVAVGDYDGDGISDLFWRNQATGANIVWRSARYSYQLQVSSVDLSYRLVI